MFYGALPLRYEGFFCSYRAMNSIWTGLPAVSFVLKHLRSQEGCFLYTAPVFCLRVFVSSMSIQSDELYMNWYPLQVSILWLSSYEPDHSAAELRGFCLRCLRCPYRAMNSIWTGTTGSKFRSYVLGVMSPARFLCAMPVDLSSLS